MSNPQFPDRTVDTAARHAPPGRLAVRDQLLVVLSVSAGMYDAICFLTFGKVFTAFQTGNIVFLGIGIGGTRPPNGPWPWRVVVSMAAFAVGAAVAVLILNAFNGDEEIEDAEVSHVWPRRVSVALCVAVVLEVAFFVVWVATSLTDWSIGVMLALGAGSLGIQMNSVRSLHVPAVSTTAATATYISLVSGLVNRSLTRASAFRLFGTVVGMGVGALISKLMLDHARTYAPLLPLLLTALVVAVAASALRPESTS